MLLPSLVARKAQLCKLIAVQGDGHGCERRMGAMINSGVNGSVEPVRRQLAPTEEIMIPESFGASIRYSGGARGQKRPQIGADSFGAWSAMFGVGSRVGREHA